MSDKTNDITNTTKIYIGMDIHTTNYTVSFCNTMSGEFSFDRKLPADDSELVKYIKKIKQRHFSDGDYEFILGYEAGYCGYQTARYLEENGISCKILAPHTIKRSAKEKNYKNDFADARLIAQTLFNNDYSEVQVPEPETESLDHLLRRRDKVQQNITRIKNEMTSLLAQKGFKSTSGRWSADYFKDLADFMEADELPRDVFVLEDLLEDLNEQEKRLEKIESKIYEDVAQEEEILGPVEDLMTLKGVGPIVAVNMVAVTKDIQRFKTADQFVNYLGLAPGEHSSGLKNHKLGITKNGNPRIRALLIQAAQTYCRGSAYYKTKSFLKGLEGADQKLKDYATRAYERLHKKFKHLREDLHKAHNVCVCAVARELACFIWGILSGNIE